MNDKLDHLLMSLKQNCTNVNALNQILSELVNVNQQNYEPSLKQRIVRQIIQIINKINKGVNYQKQVATCKFIKAYQLQLLTTIVCCAMEEIGHEWMKVAQQLYNLSQQKESLIQFFIEQISNKPDNCFSQLKSGSMILSIIQKYSSNLIKENIQCCFSYLCKMRHFNEIQFKNQQEQIEFRKKIQQIIINCLSVFQMFSYQKQIQLYQMMGDKLFSKILSPLVLSNFLIQKLNNQNQHPSIQIQVASLIFILVGKYGLEIQKFYQILQKLLQKRRSVKGSLFRLSNSRKLLKLIEAALRSSKVPLQRVIAISRILLQKIPTQRSQFSFWICSFFVNLVKKHRQLQNTMFDIPEIQALKYHYSMRVRSIIKQLQKKLNKFQYFDIESFSKINCTKMANEKLQQIQGVIESCDQTLQFINCKTVQEL